MTTSHRLRGAAPFLSVAALFLSVVLAPPALAMEDQAGGLVGWVESTRGVPVAGAVISVFGKGLRGRSLVTLTDSNGQFVLPSLPPGSYTLRALGSGHAPAPPRRVTVLPDRDQLFSVSLTPLGEAATATPSRPADDETVTVREAHWLMRHKRRSVLETRDADVPDTTGQDATSLADGRDAPWLPDLAGKVEVVATAAALGLPAEVLGTDTAAASFGTVRLRGRLFENGQWSLGGLLSEAESTSWRMAAEFVLEPGGGHEVEVGAGYGGGDVGPQWGGDAESRSIGAIFAQDRWQMGPLMASVGARYSYIGFLDDRNHLDPTATLEWRRRNLSVRGAMIAKTISPGGDLLTLSTLSAAPALSYARVAPGLRPERLLRFDLAIDRIVGPTTLEAHAFQEDVRDQLLNVFDDPSLTRSLRILSAGALSARGVGVTVRRTFGEAVNGSLSYTYGRSWRDEPVAVEASLDATSALSYREADFHDVVARVETFIDWSDTRVVAFYRLNALSPESDAIGGLAALTNSRFDIQLSQGLPFLHALTRADWELLLTVRNLFYENSESGALDEVAVVNPPTRVLGGISIRF